MRTPEEITADFDHDYPNELNPFRLYSSSEMARIGETVGLSDPIKLARLQISLRDAAYDAWLEGACLPPNEPPGKRKDWLNKNLLALLEKLEKNVRSLGRDGDESRRINDFWPALEEEGDERFDEEFLKHLRSFKGAVGLTENYLSGLSGMKPNTLYRHELVFAFLKVFSDFFPKIKIRRGNDGDRITGPFVEFIRAAAVPILGEGRLLNAEILCAVSYHSYMKKMADF